MSTQIPAEEALDFINYYRQGLPAGSLKSAWLNRDFIDAVIALNATRQLDGVRVYLAKYDRDDPQGRFARDVNTILVVPTESGIAGERKDISTAFYNYSHLCPPDCKGDEGD